MTVPEISLRIGNLETYLRPAQVITNEVVAKCCAGNFGMDRLKQGRAFRIDFGSMRLDVEPEGLTQALPAATREQKQREDR